MKQTTIGKGLILVLLTNTLVTAQDRRSEINISWQLDAGNVWITGETLTLQVPGYTPARFNLKDTSNWPEVMLRHPELLPLAEEINAKGPKELELEAITQEEEAGGDPLACARAISACLAAAAAYVGGIYALITLCAGTLGLTCVGAVLAHPILASAVGFQCEEAMEKCGSGGGKTGRDGKPVGQ